MMMAMACYPNRVKCKGQGLTFGYIDRPITSTIDTRRAGPGELTVFCLGPSPDWPALSELKEEESSSSWVNGGGGGGLGSGVFTLIVRPQDVGLHRLHIRYNGQDVTGSPFRLRVSSASLLTFSGSGLQNGLLGRFEPEFLINTEKAGKGDIKIKIGGPRGAFKMMTRAIGRTLYCWYNVFEPGEYIIEVLWCGDPVPQSPFRIYVWRSIQELIMHRHRYN